MIVTLATHNVLRFFTNQIYSHWCALESDLEHCSPWGGGEFPVK